VLQKEPLPIKCVISFSWGYKAAPRRSRTKSPAATLFGEPSHVFTFGYLF